MRRIALALTLAALISGSAIAGKRGSGGCTIRDKDYTVKGYVRDGKLYDKDYRIQGYINDNKMYDREYRQKGYLEKDNLGGGGGSGKSR